MNANSKCSSKTHDSGVKTSVANKICNEEEKYESNAQRLTANSTTNDNEVEEGSRDRKWPEEDYIVFCFREDGAIHLINESKPSKTYGDNNKKCEEQRSNEMESEWPEDEIKEIDSATIVAKGCEEDSFESCNSNQSDTSANSFSFPKLGIEWTGSPVHMPKSAEKHEAASVLLHCCRF
ncbi:protein BREAKING OF ASYMMETRY IN THE STOMATAL LINEAGE-like [Primulina tabacum]|uniref:protein BREAKING OF ASYMMETRY IN THE STOMATAL LINEAGE-like n=1 Tax=Primulina tabacum TaxID=48773 RepID=UPI003F5AC9ED